jgi:hypothetical protein
MARKKTASPEAAPAQDLGTGAAAQPRFQIEIAPMDSIVPYARNAKLHTDEQISEIMASFQEFGFINPLLLDAKGSIVAGHGRFKAAQRLGYTEAPVIRLGHLSPAQVKALRIADNQLGLKTGWNADLLSLELTEMADDGYNMELLGFGDQIDEWLTASADPAPSDDDGSEGGGAPAGGVSSSSSESSDDLIRGDVERIVLLVDKKDFIKAAQVITEIKESEGLENVTEVFLHLLMEWNRLHGSKRPSPIPEGSSDAAH